MASSYLLANVIEKHGGEAKLVDEVARRQLWYGSMLLAVAVALAVTSFFASGRLAFPFIFIIGGTHVLRGWSQRRRKALDERTRRDLIRRGRGL